MSVPTKEDFANEVKTDRLRTLYRATLLGCALALFMLVIVLPLVTSRNDSGSTYFMAVTAVAVGCFVSAFLLNKNYLNPAVWSYALGIMIGVMSLLISGETTMANLIPFVLPILVFIVGLLLPPSNTFTLALMSAVGLILVPRVHFASMDFMSGSYAFAMVLIFISALLSTQVTGELYQIAEWALMNYQKERQTNDELFEKRMALQKSLQRSEALSNELRDANKDLEASRAAEEEAKHFRGQFLANMSHELRTPLNAIIGFSETMLQFPMMYDNVPLPDTYNNDMSQIYSSGRQLLHVINDILDLAKVDAGKLDVDPVHVDPEPVVLAAISTAKGLIGGKPITLDKDLAQPMPHVWADESRLRQVLLNLYSNAVKFTDKGFIKLTVREAGDEVQFSLQDTGRGIAPEHQGIIFEEFKQASTTGRDPHAGSGLGLTISRQLLDLMGGRIWVESKVGEGSTFHFAVPKYVGQDKRMSQESLVAAAPAVEQPTDTKAPEAKAELAVPVAEESLSKKEEA